MIWCALAAPSRAAVLLDQDACGQAALRAQQAMGTPPALLHAIGLVETGRTDTRGRLAAWPWSVDSGGVGHFYPSKQAAIDAVLRFQKAGSNSIDVGCMQVNLRFHPDAFRTLEDAFAPATNTTYAARFLVQLYGQHGDWAAAAGAYHSNTPALGNAYRGRVMALWQDVPPAAASDPHHLLNADFAARLRQDAAFRTARDAAMGLP